jgi:hypothetical protein
VVAAGADGGVLPGALVLRRALSVVPGQLLRRRARRCGRDCPVGCHFSVAAVTRNDAARTSRRRRCAKRDRRIGSQSPVIDTPE